MARSAAQLVAPVDGHSLGATSSSPLDAIVENGLPAFPTVSSVLCPTVIDIADVTEDMPLCGELMDILPRGETETCGVSDIISSVSFASLFRSIRNGTTTLAALLLNIGLATKISQCDHVLKRDSAPYAFFELKAGNVSPLMGNHQSAMYGTHFAMGHLKRSTPRQHVIVPSYTYNGMLIQFGATIVLEPSLPASTWQMRMTGRWR